MLIGTVMRRHITQICLVKYNKRFRFSGLNINDVFTLNCGHLLHGTSKRVTAGRYHHRPATETSFAQAQ